MRKLLLLFSMLLACFAADAQCVANFDTATAPLNNQLLRVQFTNLSSWGLPFTGQIRYAKIYYGDGTDELIGTGSPAHTFPSPGMYVVSMRIYSIDSATSTVVCTDSIAKNVTINYTNCGTRYSVSGSGLSRTFTANTPAGAFGMTYSWNFGDGTPAGTGAVVSHTYAANGTYPVTLTATRSSTSCTYTNTQSIGVYTPPPPLVCSTLRASFNTSVTSNMLTTTNTSNTVTSPYKMDVTWRYGDGTTSNSFSPLPHAYTAPGMYIVSLVMTWRDSLSTTLCRDSTTRTVAITSVPAPPNVISGTVTYDSTLGTNFFKVWLIRFDSASNLLTAVDSQITANTAFAFYSFAGKPAGLYRTKAAVHLGSTSGTGVIPTYHDSSAYWNLATVINHAGFSTINKNIRMRIGTLGSGPGFIGGNVSLGANKGAANGVPSMLIFLRDQTTRIVRMTYTDANGDYSFANIPTGHYSVYPEEMNFSSMPVTPIAVTDTRPEIREVNFNKDLVKRSIAPRAGLGLEGARPTAAGLTVYPIPASGQVTITWKGAEAGDSRFIITSITGNVVARTAAVQGHEGRIDLNVADLARGVYFVQGTGAMSGSVTRLVIR